MLLPGCHKLVLQVMGRLNGGTLGADGPAETILSPADMLVCLSERTPPGWLLKPPLSSRWQNLERGGAHDVFDSWYVYVVDVNRKEVQASEGDEGGEWVEKEQKPADVKNKEDEVGSGRRC